MKTLSAKFRKCLLPIVLMPMLGVTSVCAGPPDNSGPYVVRLDDFRTWNLIIDNGLAVAVGADFDQFCLNWPPAPGEQPLSDDSWDALAIFNPSVDNLVMGFTKGDDVEATIYPANYFHPLKCDLILNEGPIATGTVDATVTVNSFPFNVTVNPSKRANTLHWSFHGVLESTATGDPVMVTGGLNCVVQGTTPACEQRISLN